MRQLSKLDRKCLKILEKFASPSMKTREIRIAAKVMLKDEEINNTRVLKSLKRLREQGYVVSEMIDHQLYWELSS